MISHGQLDILIPVTFFQRAVRNPVIKVHDETQRHPYGEPHQGQNRQLKDQINVDSDGHCWNERQTRRHEHQSVSRIQNIKQARSSVSSTDLFCGFLDMASRTPTIANKNRKQKNVNVPVILCMPHTIMRSKTIINKYKQPTIFITNMPDSSVAGPVSTHGKIAGHR